MPRRCLYDDAKVVTVGRNEEKQPVRKRRMLDFALRVAARPKINHLAGNFPDLWRKDLGDHDKP